MTFSTDSCTEFFLSLLPDVQRQAESQEGTFVRVHLLDHKRILQVKKKNNNHFVEYILQSFKTYFHIFVRNLWIQYCHAIYYKSLLGSSKHWASVKLKLDSAVSVFKGDTHLPPLKIISHLCLPVYLPSYFLSGSQRNTVIQGWICSWASHSMVNIGKCWHLKCHC